jgi:hypothetical protein
VPKLSIHLSNPNFSNEAKFADAKLRAHGIISAMRLPTKPLLILTCLIVSLASGCGNAKLFNIAPRVEVAPDNFCCKTNVSNITVAAEALTDEDKVIATFDGNILLAGVLPVRVLVENHSSSSLDLNRVQFLLVDATGNQYKQLETKKALDRMVGYYGISYQRQGAYKATLEDLTSVSFSTQPPLAANETRQGFVYFAVDPAQGIPQGLKIIVKRLRLVNENKDSEATVDLTASR